MFRVREVVFDENLDEVAYVIEGTEADFRISDSTRNTVRRLLYVKDLKERRATINKFISYRSGELEFSDGMHHTVEKVYLLKGNEVVEQEAEIKDIKALVYTGLNGVEYSLNKFHVTALGMTRDVNIWELRRLMKWLPNSGEFRIAKPQSGSGKELPISVGYRLMHKNFPYKIQRECVSLDTVSPEFVYRDTDGDDSITGFVKFVRALGGKFAVKREFDSSVLSTSLEVVSVDEWEFAEPRCHYSLSNMVVYLSTERKATVKLRVNNEVLPKEYSITVKSAFPLVVNGKVVKHDNLAVMMPSDSECNKLISKYTELVLFSPIKDEQKDGYVGYYSRLIGLSVNRMWDGKYFVPNPMHLWFLLEEEARLQREIEQCGEKIRGFVRDEKSDRFSAGEEQRLREANIDPVTMCSCKGVKIPSSKIGVLFRLSKSLAVTSKCDEETDEFIKRSAGETKVKGLNDTLIRPRENLSCLEKLIWMTAHQRLKYERYRYFQCSKEWNLSFIGNESCKDGIAFGNESIVEVYSTALEGLTVIICHSNNSDETPN